MENPGECSVCFTTLDELEHRPRTLPCGHTFCSPCIGGMIEGDQLACPTCRDHHTATSATQFPINFIAEAFVRQRKATKPSPAEAAAAAGGDGKVEPADDTSQKQFTSIISMKLQSMLEEQKSSVSSLLKRGREVQSQLDQYRRIQLTDWKTQHLHLVDRLCDKVELNKTAINLLEQEDTRVLDMKKEGEEGEKQLEAVMESLSSVSTAQEVFSVIDYADHCTVEAEDWMQKCQELFDDNIVNTSRKAWDVTKTAMETTEAEIAATEDNTKMGTYMMIGLGILTLGLYLSSASLSVTSVGDCTTWTPSNTRNPLPHPTSTLFLGQSVVVQVEVDLIPSQCSRDCKLDFSLYNSNGRVGNVGFHISSETEMGVGCVGNHDDWVPASWSTPATLMTGPRHVIIQVEADMVTVLEVVDGTTKLVATHTCDQAYPDFPDITVKVMCSRKCCWQVKQCKEVRVLTAALVVAVAVVVASGGVAAAVHYRRRFMRAAHYLAWHLRVGSPLAQPQAHEQDQDQPQGPGSVTPGLQ